MKLLQLFYAIGMFALSTISFSQSTLLEKQPMPDLGNGYYRNPVLAGNWGDPSVVRVDSTYYMIHSQSLQSAFLIWKSFDLVNWQPIGTIPLSGNGSPWAPDLVYVNGKFYVYVTQTTYFNDGSRTFDNYVYTASNILGPWSNGIDLKIKALIDPGHIITPQGKRFLYFDKGIVVELKNDGLSAVGEQKKVYEGWQIPADWVIECPCLESPKLFYKNGYCYLVSAMGGTSGPATSHMVIVARSKSPLGPWQESPYNPIIRTYASSEKWWQQGHATLIEDVKGEWWAMYHAREYGKEAIGRQSLLLPITWLSDGWPVVKNGTSADAIIKKPYGASVPHGLTLSDDFNKPSLGMQWKTSTVIKEKITCGDGKLVLPANGITLADAYKIALNHSNFSFEVEVEVEISEGCEGGILVGNSGIGIKAGVESFMVGELFDPASYVFAPVLYDNGKLEMHRKGELPALITNRCFLKIRNEKNDISVFVSSDGLEWKKLIRSFRSGSVNPTLYALGKGQVVFRRFKYRGLD